MSEQNNIDIFDTFDVILRWVEVTDALPIEEINARFNVVNPAIRKSENELLHKPGYRLMSVLQLTESVPSEDVVRVHVTKISPEIDSKIYKARCATIEETLAHMRLFPEDFPFDLSVMVFGEYIIRGEKLNMVRMYTLDSRYVMSLSKLEGPILQSLFCVVFEEVCVE